MATVCFTNPDDFTTKLLEINESLSYVEENNLLKNNAV
jgi:hypothetical protein